METLNLRQTRDRTRDKLTVQLTTASCHANLVFGRPDVRAGADRGGKVSGIWGVSGDGMKCYWTGY
jgi:hypothetical protein